MSDRIDTVYAEAEKESQIIVKKILNDVERDVLEPSSAMLAVAMTLLEISQKYYKSKEEYMNVVDLATYKTRHEIFPHLGVDKPCGKCLACRRGKQCTNPVSDNSLVSLSAMGILSFTMIDEMLVALDNHGWL